MKLVKSKFHFIGIGGIGMSGLAELLHNMGAQVTGSDLRENDQTLRLKFLGVKVFEGHSGGNITDCDVVVYSSAVKPDNPEMLAAKSKFIPRIPRAEALAEIMNLKRGIAVGGTHGKTTTTSMLASIFIHAGKKPTISVGGRLDMIKSTALLGKGEWMIAEADESDGSFSRLNHEYCIITNIDNDHMDHYHSMENLKHAFYDFALKVPFYGAAIVCGDDSNIRETFKDFTKKIIFYGFNKVNDYYLEGENGNYKVYGQEEGMIGEMKLSFPGKHNASNALASAIVANQAGISWHECFSGLSRFEGVDRRFQFRGKVSGSLFYDDYGHHPTEVSAVLQAFKEKFPSQKVYALFQPHRYSRTQSCWQEFTHVFQHVDKAFLLDIYPAGESPIKDIDSERLAKEIKDNKGEYVKDFDKAKATLSGVLQEGDVLVCLGAGDIYKFFSFYNK